MTNGAVSMQVIWVNSIRNGRVYKGTYANLGQSAIMERLDLKYTMVFNLAIWILISYRVHTRPGKYGINELSWNTLKAWIGLAFSVFTLDITQKDQWGKQIHAIPKVGLKKVVL